MVQYTMLVCHISCLHPNCELNVCRKSENRKKMFYLKQRFSPMCSSEENCYLQGYWHKIEMGVVSTGNMTVGFLLN